MSKEVVRTRKNPLASNLLGEPLSGDPVEIRGMMEDLAERQKELERREIELKDKIAQQISNSDNEQFQKVAGLIQQKEFQEVDRYLDGLIKKTAEFQFYFIMTLNYLYVSGGFLELINPETGENYRTWREFLSMKKQNQSTYHRHLAAIHTALEITENDIPESYQLYVNAGVSALSFAKSLKSDLPKEEWKQKALQVCAEFQGTLGKEAGKNNPGNDLVKLERKIKKLFPDDTDQMEVGDFLILKRN